MTRDDALYTEAVRDIRRLVPLRNFRGRTDAARVLLAPGADVRWNERGDDWRSTGFIALKRAGAEWGHEDSGNAAGAIAVTDPAIAWQKICAELGSGWFYELTPRLVSPPASIDAVLALASAPEEMRRAEALVREAFARLAPFGGPPPPPIFWRTIKRPEMSSVNAERSAFDALYGALLHTLDRDTCFRIKREAEQDCSFSRWSPPTDLYRWIAVDLAGARLFDHARAQKVTTKEDPRSRPILPPAVFGVALAELDNPWESLLRVGVVGFGVEELAPDRAVLVACE